MSKSRMQKWDIVIEYPDGRQHTFTFEVWDLASSGCIEVLQQAGLKVISLTRID